MSTRSSARNLFPPLDNPELTIRRRSRTDPTLLNNSEMAAEGNGDLPVPDLWTMEELCQPSLNGRGGPISPISIQATKFGLKNDMIQQSIKVNGVTDDALRLYLFSHSLTHHATAWFDRLPRNSINTFEQMAKMFLGKYFPPSMVTKLRNEITNFRQRPDESLLEAWLTNKSKKLLRTVKLVVVLIPSMIVQPPLATPRAYMLREPIKNQNFHNQNKNQGNHNPQENNQGRNQFFQGASHGQNPPPSYQAPAYQALFYQAPVHQPQNPQPQVVTTNEFTNFMKANYAILKNMQTNMTSLINSNLELKNMFGQFIKMNIASSSGSGTLKGNTITNPKEGLKGITTQSGTAYQGPTIPTTSSFSPSVVERETDATKDTMYLTNNGGTKDVQPLVFQKKSLILNFEPIVAPIIELVASPNKLSLPDLSPMCMTLELIDRSISRPVRVAEDVFVKVGTFHFLADFVVVDFDADPRVPLILRRSFLKTERALIDVFEGELTLHVCKEAITFNLNQTSRYSANYNDMMAN
uniref:Reverse transcriptase domain-containing protein n=1 Tax=Tanacetum cinerariifolium TaxID=118510 RepID=A0A6L2MWF6_TANCI|nr:reverse transcriptase domain-containing protein [Tanacetum cinerariifolium]